ncbi:hypothetical protein ACQEU3_30120 [Spirillospora sp. CA-253888]
MSGDLTVRRVLGDHAFAEIGFPTAAAVGEPRGLVVAGGRVGPPRWQPGTLGGDRSAYRIGIYGLDDLRCRFLLPSRWPVNTIAFHPVLPLAAVGTGDYDGGYLYQGELLLLDLASGEARSLLEEEREVRSARWRGERRLDLVLSPRDDDHRDDGPCFAASIVRDDWAEPVRRAEIDEEPVPEPADEREAAERALRRLAAWRGEAEWSPRRQVRSVEPLRDGRVLAALDGVRLESWLPSGRREWSVPVDGGGRRVVVAPDERSAWVEVQWAPGWDGSRWRYRPNGVERLSLDNGEILRPAGADVPLMPVGRRDGWVLLRDTRHETTGPATVLVSPENRESAPVDLGGCPFEDRQFRVRRSPELLLLLPGEDGSQVAALDPADSAVHQLFPADWGARPGAWFTTGPGVRVPDALVHAGAVSVPGPERVEGLVVRRRFPGGEPEWDFSCGAAVVTAMDVLGGTLWAALDSGQVVLLDARNGALLRREPLAVDGLPVSGTSLAATGDGVLIGTEDGRVLDVRARPV